MALTSPRMLTWEWREHGNITVWCHGQEILKTNRPTKKPRTKARADMTWQGRKVSNLIWLMRRRVAEHLAKRFADVE